MLGASSVMSSGQPDHLPSLRAGRDLINRLQDVFEVTDRTWEADPRAVTTTWRPKAG